MAEFFNGLGPSVNRPTPIDEEVVWDKSQTIMSRTDRHGVIINVNQTFVNVCGYSADELIGEPHNLIRHPDMPQIAFKVLWDNILEGKNFHAIVKNLAKSGRYYWVITDFEVERNAMGHVTSILARRHSVPQNVISEYIEPLYATLLKLERIGGMELSGRYFKGFLEKHNKTYVEFIMDILEENQPDKKAFDMQENSGTNAFSNSSNISDDIFDNTKAQAHTETKRKSFFARLFSIN
ncbi:MAG: PAS domain-containing protein [Capnocytophaga sp.]|nr:PAS domain-containing protein [Capnocytophaga sp.]